VLYTGNCAGLLGAVWWCHCHPPVCSRTGAEVSSHHASSCLQWRKATFFSLATLPGSEEPILSVSRRHGVINQTKGLSASWVAGRCVTNLYDLQTASAIRDGEPRDPSFRFPRPRLADEGHVIRWRLPPTAYPRAEHRAGQLGRSRRGESSLIDRSWHWHTAHARDRQGHSSAPEIAFRSASWSGFSKRATPPLSTVFFWVKWFSVDSIKWLVASPPSASCPAGPLPKAQGLTSTLKD
jgi:hypothetical protein